jgi:N-acetylated-alpha-linked acidic dipeptidase
LFHRAAAQLYGSIMLSFSDSLFLQYDFIEVARDLRRGEAYLLTALQREARSTQLQAAVMNRLALSIKEFEEAAVEVTTELKEMRDAMVNLISGELVVDLKKVREMNTRLLMTEKAFMLPAGLPKMPWLKHVRMQLGEVT